jgi:hypothetical protein
MYVARKKKEFNSCKSCCKRFDDLILRPWLIYNYDKELLDKKDEFMDIFMNQGD